MSDFIQDGTGTGYRAKVDSDNHLHTRSISESGGTDAALSGNLYNVNTETVELTSANASALVYMKNTDTVPWVVNRVFYNAGPSTGGTGDFLAEVVANPTTGTLISGGSALTPHNLNFGSSQELTGTVLKGGEGSTITNGTVRVSTIIPVAGTRVLIGFDSIILDVGSSIAVRITPQTSNTSMDIQVGFNLYRYTVGV
jgi:hypothetical protein